MVRPTDKKGLKLFLGTVNHVAQFYNHLSSVTQRLQTLTHEDAEFLWSEAQEEAFLEPKRLVAQAPVLMYYDLQFPVTLQVDASEKGLGGTLLQPNRDNKLPPVAFTSSSLNKTEKRYSQIHI